MWKQEAGAHVSRQAEESGCPFCVREEHDGSGFRRDDGNALSPISAGT
jgi:hypothetical protein